MLVGEQEPISNIFFDKLFIHRHVHIVLPVERGQLSSVW